MAAIRVNTNISCLSLGLQVHSSQGIIASIGVLVVGVSLIAPSMPLLFLFPVMAFRSIFVWGPAVIVGLFLLAWLDKREKKKTDHDTGELSGD